MPSGRRSRGRPFIGMIALSRPPWTRRLDAPSQSRGGGLFLGARLGPFLLNCRSFVL